jgi:predicted acylesterase/phospholipase RssA
MYSSGLPGQIAFSPLFTEAKKAELDALFSKDAGPTVFTNATRATDFEEIYQYTGTTPESRQLAAMTGSTQKRQVMRMTAESFFASGARPPYIAPMPVNVDGQTEYWMEGAMRCNPPLTPLIDMDATHIIVLRFFSKDARSEPNNNMELNERFLDAIFNIPLQKEIESIEFNNHIARCLQHLPDNAPVAESLRRRREITILDPADGSNIAASPRFIEFLSDELNALSHYDANIPARRAQMFDRGVQIGEQLIADLLKHLPAIDAAGNAVSAPKQPAIRLADLPVNLA